MQLFQHRFRFLRHLVIPKSDDCYALRLKMGCAFSVSALSVGLVMLAPVHLDRYSGLVTVKIQHIGRNGILAAEFQPAESSVSEQVPEQMLGAGLAFAEIAGEGQEPRSESRPVLCSLTWPSAVLCREEKVFFIYLQVLKSLSCSFEETHTHVWKPSASEPGPVRPCLHIMLLVCFCQRHV